MNYGALSNYFSGVGWKVFSSNDTQNGGTQREVNASASSVSILGGDVRTKSGVGHHFAATFVYDAGEVATQRVEGYLSRYDHRRRTNRNPAIFPSADQRAWLLCLQDFISLLLENQTEREA